MDVHRTEPPGSVVLQKTAEESLRLPLAPTERIQKNNAAPVARKPRPKEVTSRYKSGTPTTTSPAMPATSQRCPSPTVNRTGLSTPPSLPKRSQSAERRRPMSPAHRTSAPSSPSRTSRPSTPVHEIAADIQLSSRRLGGGRMPDGLWPSMRSLSAQFQSESVSIPRSKRNKPTSNSHLTADQTLKSSGDVKIDRKRTPSRGKNASDQSENLKPVENAHARVLDQHRWPGLMNGKCSAKDMSRSMDISDRASRSGTLTASLRGVSPMRRPQISDGPSRGLKKTLGEVTRRMSSDGNGGLEHEFGSTTSIPVNPSESASSLTRPSRTVPLPRARSPSPSSPMKTSLPSASSRSMASPSRARPLTPSSGKSSLPSASSRSMVSLASTRPSTPSSPSKNLLPLASTRGMVSPSLTRPSTPLSSSSSGRTGISSSILNYTADVRKGKKSANHIEAAHQLRLLYNRDLQWRFVNARADAAMSIQKMTAESILYSVWSTTSEMHDSVIMKRMDIQQLRQEMKLASILNEQMACLEGWALLEREHSSSLSGAVDALKANTLQLPVTGGARADVHDLKDAISSAADIMQAMSSSIYHVLSRVEGTTSVVSELAEVAAQESIMLNECRELLASTAAMQVQESSLRSHLLQMRQGVIRVGSQS